MQSLNIDFKVVPADIDEQVVVATDSIKRAELIAKAKAKAIQVQFPEAVVVAADTYIILDEEILEKQEKVLVTVGDVNYEFELKPGENFYYIISQNIEGGQYIAAS